MFEIKFAPLRDGVILPKYQHPGDAGMDIYSPVDITIPHNSWRVICLGFACEFPSAYMLLLQERSGMALKSGLFVIGKVIDSSYRGELHIGLVNLLTEGNYSVRSGMRIAQAVLVKIGIAKTTEVDFEELTETQRGTDGIGSTGE